MVLVGENVADLDRGRFDRISELPEFILHNILSNLDTKEAARSSVLSKTWYEAWSSVPVLVFRLQEYNREYWDCSMEFAFDVNDEVIQSFLGFIDRAMQRYNDHKYRISKLYLELPALDEKIELLADEWIRVGMQNQVEELYIETICSGSPDTPGYRLPQILFRAKSLKVLNCRNVVLPYYGTMELVSLEYLTLVVATVDADLIQRILSFCPLVEFYTTSDLGKISLPWSTNGNKGSDFIDTEITQSKFKASPLRKFVYDGSDTVVTSLTWQFNMNVVALKNLRELVVLGTTITDDIVSELLYGLVALESLALVSCSKLKCSMISSISLKQLRILEGFNLIKITIDAPNLTEFWYNCDVETSVSLIKVSDDCNAQLSPWVNTMESSITTDWLVKVKKILEETSLFQSLEIVMPGYLKIEVEEEQLRNVDTGLPYKLRELKLSETYAWDCVWESPLMALGGLFCICHPDVLSITTSLQDLTAETILDILNCEIQRWKHPLKSIEVEGIDSSRLLSYPPQIEFRFTLSWHYI